MGRPRKVKDEEEVYLGAQVPESVALDFKLVATKRKEQFKEALVHAIYMYIDAQPEELKKEC